MRIRRTIVATLALIFATVARADTIDVDSTTMLNVAKQTRGGTPGQPFDLVTTAPAFEILSISARDIRNGFSDDLSFVLKTWASYDIADRRWDNGTTSSLTGDVQTGYAQAKFLDRRLTLRLGRETISAGVARTIQLDGGDVVAVLPAGFKVSGYVGAPVSQRFQTRSATVSWNPAGGDLAYGGRIGWSLATPGTAGRGLDLGVSANVVTDHGDYVREEVGADARLKIIDPLVISGFYAYSIWDARTSEGQVLASVQATRALLLEADYRYSAPDLLLARTSILSVFSAEERQTVGGGFTYNISRSLKVGASLHALIEPGRTEGSTSTGSEGNAKVEWQRGPTLAGLEAFYLDALENGYAGGRLYGRRDLGPAFIAADVLLHVFREQVNGQDYALTGQATIGYNFLGGLAAVISGQAGQTPYLQQSFEVMAKLVYNQTYKKTEVR